jgi:hypothetical protein
MNLIEKRKVPGGSSSLQIGPIIGGVVAVLVILVIVIVVIIIYRR